MPGPGPKKDARRRNARPDWVTLNPKGRKGRTPKFPIEEPGAIDFGEAEVVLWKQLWRTPQAEQWETLGWTRVVARYCRTLLLAEMAMHPQAMAEARQLEDRLGLSPMAMRRLQWEMGTEAKSEPKRGGGTVTDLDEYRHLYDAN